MQNNVATGLGNWLAKRSPSRFKPAWQEFSLFHKVLNRPGDILFYARVPRVL